MKNIKESIKETMGSREVLFGCALFGLGVGLIIGSKLQYKIDAKVVAKQMKDTTVFTKVAPMFPVEMPISEIKEFLKNTPYTFSDALVVTMDGIQRIIIR
jgi:hypothetical protein